MLREVDHKLWATYAYPLGKQDRVTELVKRPSDFKSFPKTFADAYRDFTVYHGSDNLILTATLLERYY